jgi:hypothetical protein
VLNQHFAPRFEAGRVGLVVEEVRHRSSVPGVASLQHRCTNVRTPADLPRWALGCRSALRLSCARPNPRSELTTHVLQARSNPSAESLSARSGQLLPPRVPALSDANGIPGKQPDQSRHRRRMRIRAHPGSAHGVEIARQGYSTRVVN